jgi:uncharacterized repeat protein (TIGR01451 family)
VKHKTIISVLLPILFITSLTVPLLTMFSSVQPVSASSNWWDSNWTYRRAITISPLNAENSQIQINIPSSIPKSDYPSIRFLENSSSGLLPYWIENNDNNGSWVYENVAWIRRSENDDNTIYMYYHNPAALSTENGKNVFMEFANFGDNANTYNWNVDTGSDVGATVTWLQNSVRVQQGNKTYVKFRETEGLPVSEESTARTIEFRMRDAVAYRGGLLFNGSGWSNVEYACIFNGGSPDRFWQDGNSDSSAQDNTWYIAKVDMYGSNGDQLTTTFYNGEVNNYRTATGVSWTKTKDWSRTQGGSDYVSEYDLTTWNDGSTGNNPDYYYDWFFVMKYAATPPVATVGAEETPTRGVSVSISPASNSGVTGENLTYTVKVQNTGNITDNFDLAFGDNAGWTIGGLPANTGNVAPGDNFSGTLWIVVAGSPGDNDNFWVQAISEGDNTKSDNESAIASNLAVGVSVSIIPGSQNGNNGDTLNYTVTVTNIGGASDNFALTVGDNAGWSPSVLPTSLVLGPGSSDNATLSVTIPSNAIGGTIDNITVTATGGATSSASCTAQVNIARSVSVSISPSSQSGVNNATLNYTVTINNTGNVSDIYTLTPSDNAGWSPSVLPTSRTVAAFSSDNTITLSVTIPSGAIGGTVDNITLTANGTGDNASASVTATVTTVYGVQVSISPSTQYALRGDNLTYTVTVKNTGNVDDSYNLTTGDNVSPSWNPTLDDSVLAVAVSGTGSTTLRVTAGSTQLDGIWVQATSVGNPATSDNKSALANASWTYRRAITISPLNPENFQIEVVIPSVIPTSDYPSIRFLENQTTGVLPYWIEKNEGQYDNNYMNISWVRRLENDDNTIFMYYHNPSAVSAENGDNVFLFFDDFGGGSGGTGALNSSKWSASGTGVDVYSTVLRLQDYSNNDGYVTHDPSHGMNTTEENTRRIVEFRVKDTQVWRGGLMLISPNGWGTQEMWGIYAQGGGTNNTPKLFGTGTYGSVTLQTDKYYIGRVTFYGANKDHIGRSVYVGNDNANYRQLVDSISDWTSGTWNPGGANWYFDTYRLRVWDGGGDDTYYYDWFIVRDYATTDPVATVGPAEGPGVSVSISPGSQSGANGATLNYTVTVTNTGLVIDNFNLSVGDNAGWGPNVNNSVLTIAPGASDNSTTLSVTIPSNAIGGTTDLLWVQATLQLDNTVKDNESATAQVDIARSVSVSISPSSQSGANGDTLNYTVTVNNTGNVSDNFALTPSDDAGWSPGVLPTSVVVPAFSSDNTTTLSVTIPLGAIGGTTDNITVTANGTGDNSADTCTATLTIAASVSVSISPSSQSGAPGDTLVYTVTVANTGNVNDTYTLDNTDNSGWALSLSNTSVVVPAFSSDNSTTLSVTIPGGAENNDQDNVIVTATGTSASASASCLAISIITTFRGVSVSISPLSQSGVNNELLTYTVTVNNTGNVDDTYDLTWGDNAGWSPNVSPSSISVAAFGSENATLSVTIPSDAIGGTVDNIWVQAVSENDAGILDNASCTAELTVVTSVSVSIAPLTQNGNNGDTLNYTVTVSNTGNVDDTYTLDNADTLGWALSLSGTSVGPLAPNASDNSTTLSVTIPSLAIGGTTDNVTVTATGLAVGSGTCTATVNTIHTVSVSIAPSSEVTYPGGTLTYTVTVNNTGNVFDNFALVPTDDAGWSPSVLPTSVVVPAFSSDNTTTLSVTIPPGATIGTVDNITVTANGAGDNASASCTATAVAPVTGTASIRLSGTSGTFTPPFLWGIRKVRTTENLVVNVGDNLKLIFLASDNVTVESEAVIWSRTAPGAQVVNLTNLIVPHDNSLTWPAGGSPSIALAMPAGNVKRVKLVLTDSAGNVIVDNMAWYKVLQDDWSNRLTAIILGWASHNSLQQDQLTNEITAIILGWASVQTTTDQHDFSA